MTVIAVISSGLTNGTVQILDILNIKVEETSTRKIIKSQNH